MNKEQFENLTVAEKLDAIRKSLNMPEEKKSFDIGEFFEGLNKVKK